MAGLERRWRTLWEQLGGANGEQRRFEELAAHYREPHRHYHTLTHIDAMLAEFDRVRDLATDAISVELAIWYHDAIYDARASGNEQQSADLFAATAREMALPVDLIDRACSLILATRHTAMPSDPDASLLCDIDLAILGQPEEAFDTYERQIRLEYEWVPEEQFRAVRKAILESFLARPRIYATDAFQQRYEAQARANLARSIGGLGGDTAP